jgi:hypothetical protein
LWRHRADFERLAVGTYQNWRDIADLAMDSIARDPDSLKVVEDGKVCHSRLINMYNIRTNQLVRTQVVRMITNTARDIISVYPDARQC